MPLLYQSDHLRISALQILSKDQYAVVAMEEFDADLLAAADYIFLVHQDPRTEYGERAQKSAGKSAPQVHRAFLEHGKWARHACSDSAYERAAGDTVSTDGRRWSPRSSSFLLDLVKRDHLPLHFKADEVVGFVLMQHACFALFSRGTMLLATREEVQCQSTDRTELLENEGVSH